MIKDIPKEMKKECFYCGKNFGFKNIPSELCLKCSVYDNTNNKNYFSL